MNFGETTVQAPLNKGTLRGLAITWIKELCEYLTMIPAPILPVFLRALLSMLIFIKFSYGFFHTTLVMEVTCFSSSTIMYRAFHLDGQFMGWGNFFKEELNTRVNGVKDSGHG